MGMDYKLKETLKLLKPKQRTEVKELCHHADMEFARVNLDGGMVHSFFYDCVDGGIKRLITKPKYYVNQFTDFYIDARVRGCNAQGKINSIITEIVLIVDKTQHLCSVSGCETLTEKKAKEQIKEVTCVRFNHYRKYGKEQGEENPKEAELSERRLQNRELTKESYVCYFCCQNKLTKGA